MTRPDLARMLERLYHRTDGLARRAADPVAFVHRYDDPADQEIAGLLAVSLAYGKVDLFFPVLHRLFDHLDTLGGPRRAVARWTPVHGEPLHPLVYRWNRGLDLCLVLGALHRTLGDHGRVEDLFTGGGDVGTRLTRAVQALREAAVHEARAHGLHATTPSDLPRGTRYLLPSPASGSACKRWNLYLRWMVRPPIEQVDLGLWTTLTPAELVFPLDVHVHRISRFLDLTRRNDTSWRTAAALTEALRAYDPHDPVRFDFALAHLGISGACQGKRVAEVCSACPLDAVCCATARGLPARRPTRRRRQSVGTRSKGSNR